MFAHHFMYKWVLKPCPNREVTYWCEEETRGKPIYFCMCVSIGWNLKTERVVFFKKKKEAYLGFIGKLAPNTQRVSIKNAPMSWILLAWPCGGGRHWLMMKQLSLVLRAQNKRQFTFLFTFGSLSDICRASTAGIRYSTFKCSKSSLKNEYMVIFTQLFFFFMEVVKC